MFDRIFAPALTFLMLIGGTAAIGSGLFTTPRAELVAAAQRPAPAISQPPLMLERVVITAKRSQAEPDTQPAPAHKAPARQAAEGRGLMLRARVSD